MKQKLLTAYTILLLFCIGTSLARGKIIADFPKAVTSPKLSFVNFQEWDLKRSLRFSGLVGAQIVDSQYEETTTVYAAALHWRLIFSERIYGNLVLEASYSAGSKSFEFKLDENESIYFKGANTTTANINFEAIGVMWQTHNPLKILPYTTFGIGIVSRPGQEKITTYYIDNLDIPEAERYQEVTVQMKDCGKNAASINLGAGFQIYYISRVDFRIFLIRPGRIALYRFGFMLSF